MRIAVLLAAGASIALVAAGCASSTEGTKCGPDQREPNDVPTAAFDLGEMADDPNSRQELSFTTHSASDVDFFRVTVRDRGLGGNPVVTVNGPAGYEVTTWFKCLQGSTVRHACARGQVTDEPDVVPEKGCKNLPPSGSVESSTDCSDTNGDDGVVLIRVRRLESSDACQSYAVAIEVE